MKLFIFDKHPVSHTLWKSVAQNHHLVEGVVADDSASFKLSNVATPSILILDSSVCDDGLQNAAATALHDNPACAVVVTGSGISTREIVELLHQGVHWVFQKELVQSEIESAMPNIIKRASDGHSDWLEYLELSRLFDTISARETSVLQMVMEGTPNKMIAKHLNVSIRTVEARRSKFYKKLNLRSVAELVRIVDKVERLRNRFASVSVARPSVEKKECLLGVQRDSATRLVGNSPARPHSQHVAHFQAWI